MKFYLRLRKNRKFYRKLRVNVLMMMMIYVPIDKIASAENVEKAESQEIYYNQMIDFDKT